MLKMLYTLIVRTLYITDLFLPIFKLRIVYLDAHVKVDKVRFFCEVQCL